MELNIKTKFNIGDEIYHISQTKIKKAKVKTISIIVREDGKPSISYSTGPLNIVFEDEAFASQEELIQSIMMDE